MFDHKKNFLLLKNFFAKTMLNRPHTPSHFQIYPPIQKIADQKFFLASTFSGGGLPLGVANRLDPLRYTFPTARSRDPLPPPLKTQLLFATQEQSTLWVGVGGAQATLSAASSCFVPLQTFQYAPKYSFWCKIHRFARNHLQKWSKFYLLAQKGPFSSKIYRNPSNVLKHDRNPAKIHPKSTQNPLKI